MSLTIRPGLSWFAALVLAAGMLIPAATSQAASGFSDVGPSHAFGDEIEWLVANSITEGYPDGTFGTTRAVTRQAMAAFMYRLAGEPASEPPATPSFTDVSAAHPFHLEIEWMADAEISTGYATSGGVEFRPAAAVSRQAMAAFMYRLAGEPTFTLPGSGDEAFADVPGPGGSVPTHPFFTEIEWMSQFEISTGYGLVGTGLQEYRPLSAVARQAMAAFMYRMAPRLNAVWGTDYIAECADGVDNDGDGQTDFPDDPNCVDALDNDESPPPPPAPLYHGNPTGGAIIPAAAALEDVSNPDKTVGTGTPQSCTSNALAAAVRSGGVIVFDCGPAPHTIDLTQTLYTCNTTTCQHPWQGGTIVSEMVLDGGGLITLNGQGQRGIFHSNSCEEKFGWLTGRCDLDERPKIVFQNINFVNGDASQGPTTASGGSLEGVGGGGGGGAIAMRGGQLKVINASFTDNRCMTAHPDAGGGAIRVTGMEATAYILYTTIDNNRCASGGGISSLHATVYVMNSVLSNNTATGSGASSGNGGNGGGLYFDGTSDNIRIDGTIITGNVAPEGGPGVFYVSNDYSGNLIIRNTQIVDNTGQSFYTHPYRDIFYLGDGPIQISNSTIE